MGIAEAASSAGFGSFPRVPQLINGRERVQTHRTCCDLYYIVHREQFNLPVLMRSRDNNNITKVR